MPSFALPVVDLHAHLPMHIESDEANGAAQAALERRVAELDPHESYLLTMLGGYLLGSWFHREPRVTLGKLREGGVQTVCSVLYSFFDEIDGADAHGSLSDFSFTWPTPEDGYFDHVIQQLRAVEDRVAVFDKKAAEQGKPGVRVVRTAQGMKDAHAVGKMAVVHALEGGFALGEKPAQVEANAVQLAEMGVAYVTLAHLLYRHVAANVPPLPRLLPWLVGNKVDAWCHTHLPVPAVGLTPVGRALVGALVDHGVLLDLTHLTDQAMTETLDILDARDPKKVIPVMVSHGAYRFGVREHNLTDRQVVRIAQRKGVVGLFLCEDFMCDGLAGSVEHKAPAVLLAHIEKLRSVIQTGAPGVNPYDCLAIGTDLDGFIHPLPGAETASELADLAAGLHRALPNHAAQICHGSAHRLLESGATHGKLVGGRVPWAPVV